MTDKKMDLNKGLEQLSEMLDVTEGVTDTPFAEEPVDLDTFLYSGDYLRCPKLSPVQYEFVEALSDIYYGCKYTEVVAEWGKGGGKDMACAVALSRVIYSLLCLRDPAGYYKLKSGSKVEAINIAVNADQANSVFFSQFIGFLVDSPYFRRVGYKHRGGRVAFPKNVRAISGHSEMEGLEGHNVIVAILDEIDAFKTKEEVSSRNRRAKSAKFIYDRMCSSTQSRFPGLGKVACISFPRFFGSFIQTRRMAGLKEPKTFVSSPEGVPTWVANPVRTREELEDEFRKDPERSEMMYGCNPPMARDAYFRHSQHILAAFGAVMENYQIQMNDELRPIVREVHDYTPPRMNPVEGMEYFIHVDLAKNRERAGFALVCFDGENLTVALSWAFPAPRGGEIDFESIVKFITKLTEMGFVINKVTYDGWQCLSPETKVRLMNGKDVAIEDVKKDDYVYGIADGKVTPSRVLSDAKVTGKNTPMLRITLDNGEYFDCTSEHRVMMIDNTYKNAEDLSSGDSVMPLYWKLRESKVCSGYEEVHCPSRGWVLAHRFGIPRGILGHHKDGNKRNNYPTNIKQVTWDKHRKIHRENALIAMEASRSPEARKKRSLAKIGVPFPHPGVAKSAECISKLRDKVRDLWKNPEYRERQRKAHRHPILGLGTADRERRRQQMVRYNASRVNHRVVSVESIGLAQQVWDIQTETGNFGLSCGTFVHNSVGSLQELKRLGYDASTLSVKKEHYDTLKDLFYSGNVKGYYYHLLVEELVNLELVNGKTIDHKSGFTDDASDALAGASWSAVRGSGMTPGIAVFGDDDEDEDDETGVIGELSEDNAMSRVGTEIDEILRKSMHRKMTQIAEEDL